MNSCKRELEQLSAKLLFDLTRSFEFSNKVTTLFEDKYEGTKRNSKDAVLTKTMINNYTKAKVIMPPKNKKYNRQNIIVLSLIYNLKQILSINDIKNDDESESVSSSILFHMYCKIGSNRSLTKLSNNPS